MISHTSGDSRPRSSQISLSKCSAKVQLPGVERISHRCPCASLRFRSGKRAGPAALDFLGKVRDGEVDLAPGGDTSIQKNTEKAKLHEIRKAMTRLGLDLRGGNLELGEIREEEGFAAVMVKKTGDFDSGRQQIFPVAMVKRQDGWVPAPVLASFENAVAGYTVPVRAKLEMLEAWMSRQRVLSLEKLITESEGRTRDLIRRGSVGEDLEGDDIERIAGLFMKACAAGEQAAVLGFLGGLGDPLPADWPERLAASRAAVESGDRSGSVWRLVVSPDVVRVPVNTERSGASGLVSIACLDPSRSGKGGTLGKIELLHLEFSKDPQGRWRIDLPHVLLQDDANHLDSDDDLDVDLLDRFPKELRKSEPVDASESASEARDAVLAAVRTGGLRDLLSRVDLSGRGKDARIACAAAAELWWFANQPGSFRAPVELGFREDGMLAVAAFQWFSPAEPNTFNLKTLYFKKTGDGWVWAPGVVSAKERKSQRLLSKWVKDSEPEWRLSWRDDLLSPSQRMERIQPQGEVGDEEIRLLVSEWLAALSSRDLPAILARIAWLGEEGDIPEKALRNISYDLDDPDLRDRKLQKIYRSENWAGARVTCGSEKGAKELFIPTLMTPGGARLLPGIDLLAGGNRTRKFLNEASFERLRGFAGDEVVEELRELFEKCEEEIKEGR